MRFKNWLKGSTLSALVSTAPVLATAGDDFTIQPRGRFYYDLARINPDLLGFNNSSASGEIRAARLGVQGSFGKKFKYVVEFDAAGGGDIKAKDAKLTTKLADGWSLVVGNHKTPNSIEELTSSRYNTFMERAAITDTVRLSRQLGASVTKKGDRYSFTAGIFTSDINQALYQDAALITSENIYAARFSWAPVNKKNRKVHFGVHARQIDGRTGSNLRFRARPDMHLSNRLLSVSGQGSTSTLIGLEAAIVQGPWHLHGEWMQEDAADTAQGGFVQIGWFLTGEQRSYKANGGTFGRTKPGKSVMAGGTGSLELAARYDFVDVDGLSGGEMRNWTFGVNWTVQPKVRLSLNLIKSSVKGAGASFGAGDQTGGQVRWQLDW